MTLFGNTMQPLAVIVIKEVRDLDEQMTFFLISASVVILLSWALITLKKRLAIVAGTLALLSAFVILKEVRWTWLWLDPNTNQKLEPTYIAVAAASAFFPLIAIAAILIAKKRSPNQALQHNDHVRHGSCSEQHAPRQP